ncbi:hypothetical protein QAD02_015251 [Eretmocerus hayati]|uniref:Uncharacterized protein n=1 Tax=Eretmocerus hayati TaxID=131215 RepID=A0ACC2P7A7_9HYME|nr:hypothetical protein QAD02_015251 [Eretmocerus hayati]
MAYQYILPAIPNNRQGYDFAELGGLSDKGETSSSNSDNDEYQNEQQSESLIVGNSRRSSGRRSHSPKRSLSRTLRSIRTPMTARRRVSFQSLQVFRMEKKILTTFIALSELMECKKSPRWSTQGYAVNTRDKQAKGWVCEGLEVSSFYGDDGDCPFAGNKAWPVRKMEFSLFDLYIDTPILESI